MDEPLPLIWYCDLVFGIAYDRVGTYVRSCELLAGHDGACVPTWSLIDGPSPELAPADKRWL